VVRVPCTDAWCYHEPIAQGKAWTLKRRKFSQHLGASPASALGTGLTLLGTVGTTCSWQPRSLSKFAALQLGSYPSL